MSDSKSKDNIEKLTYHLYNSINVFASLIQFQRDFLKDIQNNFNKPKQTLILINKAWFSEYKIFYLYEEMLKLVSENNLSLKDPAEKKILFNNIFKNFISKNKNQKPILFYNQREEFPKIIKYKNSSICYISEFEIINIDIYNNLRKHMGDFNINSLHDDKKVEFIIYDGKVVFKFIKDQEHCYNLIIGSYKDIYTPNIYVNYINKEILEEDFLKFFDSENKILQQFYAPDKENQKIKDITEEFILENKEYNIKESKFFVHDYIDTNQTPLINNQDQEEKLLIDVKKIVKFFVKLFIEYKDIKKKINEQSESDLDYYMINKNWVDKFKHYFCYNKLKSIININNLENYIDENNIYNTSLNNFTPELLEQIKNLDYRDIIYDLSNTNLGLVNYDYYEKGKEINSDYIKVYNNFEIWSKETYDSFLDIGFNINIKPKQIKCYISEKHLFILTKNAFAEYLNIYQLNENSSFDKRMVIKCKSMKFILDKIKNEFFLKYIYSLNSNYNDIFKINQQQGDGIAYLLSKKGKIFEKIQRKKKRIEIIVNILINNDLIKRKMKYQIKKNIQDNHETNENFYLVHKQLFEFYLKQSGLFDTYNYIKTSKLIEKYSDSMPIEERKQKIIKHINENEADLKNNQFEIMSNLSSDLVNQRDIDLLDHIIVKNHNEKIFYHNDCYLIDGKTIGKINKNLINKLVNCDCLIGKEGIFIFNNSNQKHIIEVGQLNSDAIFQINLIIDIYRNYEEEKFRIIEKGSKYIKTYFVFAKDQINGKISPYFDDNKKLKGYGYLLHNNKFDKKKIVDYSDYNINNYLIKVIYLFTNFLKFDNKLEEKDVDKYYLVNENWINTFKEKCNYEKTVQDIKSFKISSAFYESLANLLKTDKDLFLKQAYLLINHIPEINKFYNNNNEINFSNVQFPPDEPSFEAFLFNKEENIAFYNNFYLLQKNAFEKIIYDINEEASNIMESKNNYNECRYYDGLIFIKLSNELVKGSKNILFEVGFIDKTSYKFILEYILIYNKEDDYEECFNYFKENGFKKFLYKYNFGAQAINRLIIGSKILGYIYKYSNDSRIKSEHQSSNQTKNSIKDIPTIENNNIGNEKDKNNPSNNNHPIIISQSPPKLPIKLQFKKAPRIGLQNVGATCYMNATLQCMCQIEKLVEHFRNSSKILKAIEKCKKKNEDCLADSFKYLIENLWPSDKEYYNSKYNLKNQNNDYFVPTLFKEKISKMNPLFKGAKANDSKDLVNFIIMRLHEELNEGIKFEGNNVPSQENEQSMFNYFKKSTDIENKSIISDLFYGINGTLYKCSKCNTQKFNFQIGFFYIFPLEEVRKFKIQNMQQIYMNNMRIQMQQMSPFGLPFMNNMNQNMEMNLMYMCQPYFASIQNINSVTMTDCFDFNQKIETMCGENSMYCNICKKQEVAYYQSYIVTAPEIIIIILNRGKGIEFNVKLEFEELLCIKKYTKSQDSFYNFKLIGVVTHLGESGASGHFIAYCKSPIDDIWYNYNDDLCFPVTNFKEQVINYAMPYILFYQKI